MRSRSFAAACTQLKAYPTRMVAVILAIVLGVGFVAATLVFGATYQAGLGAAISARYVGADVVVTQDGTVDQQALLDQVRTTPGVAYAEAQPQTWPSFSSPEAHGTLQLDAIPGDPRLRWFDLTAGQWPSSAEQIVIDDATANSANLRIGSTLTVTGYADLAPTSVSVVGIADTSSSAFSGAQHQAFAAASLITALTASAASGPIVAIADPGVSAAQLRDDIAATGSPGVTVLTSADQISQNLAKITGGAEILTIVLLGFAITAVAASGIVIANTFTILLTQRRRHIALTRCIGASRGQVRREVLAEAGLIGAIGSMIGIAVGIGIGALGARLTGLDLAGPVVPFVPLLLTGVGGVAFTAVAAYAPASRAMRIAPLAALLPVPDSAEQRRSSALRLSIAGTLTVAGLLLLAASVMVPSMLLAMAGGVLSSCGILLLTMTFLPATLRLVGRIGGVFGPPGRLAAANAHRNPGRAASTTAALMLGVGLIVTLQVGASSAQASLDRSFAERYPVDVAVTGSGSPVPPGLADAVAQVEGIRLSGELRGTAVVGFGGDDGLAQDMTILGVGDRAAAALGTMPTDLSDQSVMVPSYLLSAELAVGDRITIRTSAGSGDFTVMTGVLGEQGVNGSSLVTTEAALLSLAADARPLAVWAAVESGADLEKVTASLNRLIAAEPELSLGGSAPERAAVSSALGTIITLATALLAVAVIIAVVGIGNTLGLSVIERTRESALLRALGLHRRQLRLMLAVEAALLAGVGAAVGVLAGIGYGWIGVASAIGEAGETMVVDIPWGQLGLVLLLAVVAALLASVLPARRAVKATPTQALAEV